MIKKLPVLALGIISSIFGSFAVSCSKAKQDTSPVYSQNEDITFDKPIVKIAHAGGQIDGYSYTNSKDALENSYQFGFRNFEFDLIQTSDDKWVAGHDWEYWAKETGKDVADPSSKNYIPTFDEFMKTKIWDRFSPLSLDDIIVFFNEHQDCNLITDKVNDPDVLANIFPDLNRLYMELFSWDAVAKGIKILGIDHVLATYVIVVNDKENRYEQLKKYNIKYITSPPSSYSNNASQVLIDMNEMGIRTWLMNLPERDTYGAMQEILLNKVFVAAIYLENRYEFDHIKSVNS